ncbi:hypothetical protein I7I50_11486 [Histoplasma capsulatum G186AR]|uniref:Uncharacterized protein n=1 Tax=Ajellomyces capsulatus TaxID=5037 RepID=A0A8H8D729_AJECA|nr:hypothetical protein I7I52_02723 [Histoplasma capsulatum]QSS69998.1 hypothetical protein I7I50_11486 [Histoplasma capsulatum G186AR]
MERMLKSCWKANLQGGKICQVTYFPFSARCACGNLILRMKNMPGRIWEKADYYYVILRASSVARWVKAGSLAVLPLAPPGSEEKMDTWLNVPRISSYQNGVIMILMAPFVFCFLFFFFFLTLSFQLYLPCIVVTCGRE